MSTYAQEQKLLRKTHTFLLTRKLSKGKIPPIPSGFEIVEDRIYMPIRGTTIHGFLMVDQQAQRVAIVYDKSGDLRHNFQAKDEQIETMCQLLS